MFVWQVWDLFYQADRVRSMLVRKIQEESLRTYLFTHSSVYDSLSMSILSKMFELEQPTVHSIISKMVMNEELMVCTFITIESNVLVKIFYSHLFTYVFWLNSGLIGWTYTKCCNAPHRTLPYPVHVATASWQISQLGRQQRTYS